MSFKRTDFGFEFKYDRTLGLSKSKELGYMYLITIRQEKFNIDNLCVLCKKCGNYMDHDFGRFWKCGTCGTEVNESEVYDELYLENESWLEKNCGEPEEIPECCLTCGGPYTDCKISCNIFDE